MKRRHFVAAVLLSAAIMMTVTAFLVIGLPIAFPCANTPGHARSFTIIADSNGFNGSKNQPAPWPAMNIEKCDAVTIRIVNQDTQTHGLAVDFYAASGVAPSGGQAATVSFKATRTGQFEVRCNTVCTVHVFMQNGLLTVA